MDIRILMLMTIVLASLTQGYDLSHIKAESKCAENVYKICSITVAESSLRDILKNMCSFYIRWRDCVVREATACGSRDIIPTGWLNDRCMEQKI